MAGSARCADCTPQRCISPEPVNSLYKPLPIPAALACANTGPSLDLPASWSVLPMRPGSGTKAYGSAPQAGHDPAKRCAKQEIHRRRIIAHQQKRDGGDILRSRSNRAQKISPERETSTLPNLILKLTIADVAAYEISSQQTMTNSRSAYANQSARGVRDAPQLAKRLPLARTRATGHS